MKYFLHDCNSFNDEKITELFLMYGYEGLGLFYTILEKIGSQEKPIKTTVLKAQLKVGKKLEKCWSFMESLQLISSQNGETFNERILSYSESYQIKKQKTREKISQWRENQKDTINVTSYVPVCNPPKVKESKVKESKEDINSRKQKFAHTLEPFLDMYGRDMLNEFYAYWVEPNKSNTLFRQEQQKAWDLSRRLSTWSKNDKNYNNGTKTIIGKFNGTSKATFKGRYEPTGTGGY